MKYILIDGYNLAFRMFHGMPAFTRRDGFPVNAIMGWVRTIRKLQEQERPCHIHVFFDKGGSQRHLELHPQYKANRPEMPEALSRQMPELRTASTLLGARVIEQTGIEADDLIASAARALAADGHTVRIASGDKDFAQCVNNNVLLLAPVRASQGTQNKSAWQTLDAAGVTEKFGVPPAKIVDYLSLTGDAVDNIPGAPGVGPQRAGEWLTKYDSIDGIFGRLDTLEPARFRSVLRECEATLRLNQKLITFKNDFPGDWATPATADTEGTRAFLTRMEMHAALREFNSRDQGQLELF